ncbi:MAG: transketolase [Weeksellaceae bacterium]
MRYTAIMELNKLTQLLRHSIITSTTEAGSGHPTSSLSAVELMTALWFDGHMQYDFDDPHYIFNDRMIFSKGHAAPLLYSLYHAAGVMTDKELLSLRKFDSDFEGHPTPRIPWVDVATGSLGQGLSVGLGMALAIKLHMSQQKQTPKREPHVWVLLGDSEVAEGQIWEAAQLASQHKANNLVGILDVNRLGQRGHTMLEWDLETYRKRFESFGWNTIVIEAGNDMAEVQKAFNALNTAGDKPTMIIAKTQKGAGVSQLADKDNWHGKPLSKDQLVDALKEMGEVDTKIRGEVQKPEKIEKSHQTEYTFPADLELPTASTATRQAYGEALKLIGDDPRVVVLDAETSNSTFAETMKEKHPERFYEMFIAEQNMISVALGFSKLGFIPFASSFAAFLSRAYDQIRMIQYSEGNVKIVGSHAGVSIGVDGSSQMALEDIAMMRGLLDATILYPSDYTSTMKLVEAMHADQGISYLRLTREKTPILYANTDQFPVGGSKVLKQADTDKAVVVAAGITLHEALKAHATLAEKGTTVAVIDAYSVKPLDKKTIQAQAEKTGHVIIVEDHYPDGGLGDAVLQALQGMEVKITHLCVKHNPRSGEPAELLRYEEIDAEAIVKALSK